MADLKPTAEDGKPLLHAVTPRDAETRGELARLHAEIAARNRQEMAISELGQGALTGVDPYILLGQACALVELTLGATHCRILEITPGGRMIVRASMGSNQTFLHCERDDEENESIGMVTLLGEGPLVFSRLSEETRFKSSHLRQYHGVRAGAAVMIRTLFGPFGVIIVYTDDERTFEEYEIAFLRSTADILGEALARGRTEQALRKSEQRLRQLIASALDAVITLDYSGNVVEWNPQAEATFGLTAREVLGRPLPRLVIPPRMQRLFDTTMGRYRKGRRTNVVKRRMETTARRASGEEFPVEITMDPVGSGSDQTVTAFVRDISDRRRAQLELEQREKRFRTIVEKSWSGVVLLDQEVRFHFTGSSTERLLGYKDDEILGRALFDFVHPREEPAARKVFDELLASPNKEAHGELRFRHKSGKWVWLEGFAQNMLHDPDVGAVVLNYRDVTQRKETEKILEYQSYYDNLTGLPNRLLFRDRLVNAVAHGRRNKTGLAVMYFDVDHFKLVNDALGHSVGDALIAEVARRLQGCLRASDTVSRIGGDEFAVLLNEVSGSEAVAGIANKVLDSLHAPITVDGHELYVTGSIGVSFHPADGEDVETLLKCADAAMYRAKELGRNQAQFFTAAMNERYTRRLALEQRLHHAIERSELDVYYQPIYDRVRRRIVSLEALIRWHDPTRGLIGPGEFIGLAEESGLIVPIGQWVLRTAMEQLRRWHEAGLAGLRMAVNISGAQFQQPDLVEMITESLAVNNIPPRMLTLEITESVAVQNVDLSKRVLRDLKERGVGIAVDDFGTGQSSLIYLKQFPIDTIKIDKEFLKDVITDETAAAIVSHVITLAHTMKMSVVAEGVETEEQYTFLRHYACDMMQGYLFSRPVPAADVPRVLASATLLR